MKNELKDMLKEQGFALYLGGSLVGFAGMSPLDWRFYAITVPIIILVAVSKDTQIT